METSTRTLDSTKIELALLYLLNLEFDYECQTRNVSSGRLETWLGATVSR